MVPRGSSINGMADKSKTEVLPPPPANENGGREWLIDDSARALYRSTLIPRQVQLPPPSRRAGRKDAETSVAGSRGTNPASEHTQDRNAISRARIRIWAVLALVCASLAYGIWLLRAGSGHLSNSTKSAAAPRVEKLAESTSQAAAQPNQAGLSLSPSLAIIQCEPGKSASQTLTLSNNTTSELTFQVVALDMVVQDGKARFVRPGAILNGLAVTAVLSQKYLNIKPGQTASLSATFTVHPQTTARGVLLLIQGTDKATFGGTTAVTPTLGTLISFVVPEDGGSGLPGVAPSPLATPTSYTFSQWETVASSSVLDPGPVGSPATGQGSSQQ